MPIRQVLLKIDTQQGTKIQLFVVTEVSPPLPKLAEISLRLTQLTHVLDPLPENISCYPLMMRGDKGRRAKSHQEIN